MAMGYEMRADVLSPAGSRYDGYKTALDKMNGWENFLQH